MFRIDEFSERLKARVPDLEIQNAGQFARLIESNQLPQFRKGAFVLPGRLSGGQVQTLTGFYAQAVTEGVSVVLVVRVASDPTGARALDEITPLIRSVVNAVCGWGPADAPGVFVLASGELVGSQQGALIFQLDFSLMDQLRITP